MAPKQDNSKSESTKTGKNQRSHLRVPMMVKVVDAKTGAESTLFSREVSRGGLFLETDSPLAVGKVLQMVFQIPGFDERICVQAKVVHSVLPGDPKNQPGMGLSFIDMDGHSEAKISEYIDKLERIRQKLSK